jgi:hypothetical protein
MTATGGPASSSTGQDAAARLHTALLAAHADLQGMGRLARSLAARILEDTGWTTRITERGTTSQGTSATGDEVLITLIVSGAEKLASGDLTQALQGFDHAWLLPGTGPDAEALEAALMRSDVPWTRLGGIAPASAADGPWAHESLSTQALASITSLLRTRIAPGGGLFTRLAQRDARYAAWRWSCDNCDDPDCEHALRVSLTDRMPGA